MAVTAATRSSRERTHSPMADLQRGLATSTTGGYAKAGVSPAGRRRGTSPAGPKAGSHADSRPEWNLSNLRKVEHSENKPTQRSPATKVTRGRTPSPVARAPKPILKLKKEEEVLTEVPPVLSEGAALEGLQNQTEAEGGKVEVQGSKSVTAEWNDGLAEQERDALTKIINDVAEAAGDKVGEKRASIGERKKKERIVTPEAAKRRAEIVKLDGEIDRRRTELHKLKVAVASATVEKASTDLAVKRIKQELSDWSSTARQALADGGELTRDESVMSTDGVTKRGEVKAELDRVKVENEVLRRREASLTADVEYVESLLAKEREEGVTLRAKLAEARTELAKQETVTKEASTESAAARAEAAAALVRATTAESEALLLREQLAKAHAEEEELLEQLKEMAKDTNALRAALAEAKQAGGANGGDVAAEGGKWEAEEELKGALQRAAELEEQLLQQAGRILEAERLAEEEVGRRKTAEGKMLGMEAAKDAAVGEAEALRKEVEELRAKLIGDVAEVAGGGDASALGSRTASAASYGGAVGAMRMNVPNRVWNLLEQVEAAKTSAQSPADQLVRIHWLTAGIRSQLLDARFSELKGACASPLLTTAAAGIDLAASANPSVASHETAKESATIEGEQLPAAESKAETMSRIESTVSSTSGAALTQQDSVTSTASATALAAAESAPTPASSAAAAAPAAAGPAAPNGGKLRRWFSREKATEEATGIKKGK